MGNYKDYGLRKPDPDFDRIKKTVKLEEPDRVPLLESLVEYPVQSQFLGREVKSDDIKSQVEFYYQAGYDLKSHTKKDAEKRGRQGRHDQVESRI